jgi:hypothetical protein
MGVKAACYLSAHHIGSIAIAGEIITPHGLECAVSFGTRGGSRFGHSSHYSWRQMSP